TKGCLIANFATVPGVVIITAIAWLLHGQKLDAWGFVGMGLIIAAFLLARSPSWKSLRRPTPW
ncbi:TPA: hypothetical protein N6M67_005124, partial [Escherichia coli]|nr:hypothetical protein [Escherichia coli]